MAGIPMGLSFDSGGLSVDEIARMTAEMWADLRFDKDALAALKRDGLHLEGLNLGGISPYHFAPSDEATGMVIVRTEGADAEILIDLWQVHFRRGLKPYHQAA